MHRLRAVVVGLLVVAAAGCGSRLDAAGQQQAAALARSAGTTATAPTSAAPPAAGCPGSGTDVGLTRDTVTLGTVASLSGPVSGLFAGAVQGMRAFAAYANSQGGICGRKVVIESQDDATSCSLNENETEQLAGKVFAFVGSFSLFDGCGAKVLDRLDGVPDVHVGLDPAAKKPASHFDLQPGVLGYPTGMFAYYTKKYGARMHRVGTLSPNIPSAAQQQAAMVKTARVAGWRFVYQRSIDSLETDWTADFAKMCHQEHITAFFTSTQTAVNAAKMVTDEQRAGCPRDLLNIIPIAYDAAFLPAVGDASAAENLQGWNGYALFFNRDEAQRIPELALFQHWFHAVAPDQPLNLYALFAWADGRLFQQAFEHAGPVASRAAVMDALGTIRDFTANGIVAPATPSSKTTGVGCYILWRLHAGRFERVDDPDVGYRCDGHVVPAAGS